MIEKPNLVGLNVLMTVEDNAVFCRVYFIEEKASF